MLGKTGIRFESTEKQKEVSTEKFRYAVGKIHCTSHMTFTTTVRINTVLIINQFYIILHSLVAVWTTNTSNILLNINVN